ncbi:hypothetical protein CGLAMM_02530 [Acetobacteraceae bacterium EV16G]|uniref:Alpha/beta hydrolase n=1 Tax=Sorlinia euscelidii TaxID=3081148 RepID=A0ABU7U239_9PROT
MTEISTEFANDGYFVRSFIPAQTSDVIVVSFTGVRANERYDGTFFGQQVAKALNIPFIGIVARSESWYLENGINEAIAEVRRLIAPIRAACQHHVRIVGYGVSMGGYAAIKYARALEFDAVISLAPIYSIDFEETGRLNFCSGFYQPYMKGMAPKNDEVTAPCYILYDPHNAEDKIEAEVIRDNIHNVRCVAVPYATHMVGFSLKGSRNFAAMLETVLANGDSTPVIRKIRSRSAENILYMLVACHGKKPTLLVKALNSRRACETGARERFLTSYREPGRAAARLIDLGHCEKAFTLLKMLHNPDIAVPIFSKLLTGPANF